MDQRAECDQDVPAGDRTVRIGGRRDDQAGKQCPVGSECVVAESRDQERGIHEQQRHKQLPDRVQT
jgi:hypothetical protein